MGADGCQKRLGTIKLIYQVFFASGDGRNKVYRQSQLQEQVVWPRWMQNVILADIGVVEEE
jgi:hypothetical protein